MLVDLIDRILGRIIDLERYRYEIQKALLDDHINPIYSEFKLLHEEYLKSFEKYREFILSNENSQYWTRHLMDIIETDSMFKINRNTELYYMAITEYENNNLEYVQDFLLSIFRYLNVSELIPPEHMPNMPRSTFIGRLFAVSMLCDQYPLNMQDGYAILRKYSCHELPLKMTTDCLCGKLNIDLSDPMKIDKLKKALSIDSLDEMVILMQSRYQEVTSAYYELKKKVSGSPSSLI